MLISKLPVLKMNYIARKTKRLLLIYQNKDETLILLKYHQKKNLLKAFLNLVGYVFTVEYQTVMYSIGNNNSKLMCYVRLYLPILVEQ